MKTKRKTIFLLIFIAILLNIQATPQVRDATPEEIKENALLKLQSSSYHDRYSKVLSLTHYSKIPEVVPILERDIFKQDRTLAYYYLLALDFQESPNFISIAHQFINSVDTMRIITPAFSDSLEMKVDATRGLFYRGDFTTASYIFDLIEREKPNTFIGAANLLAMIIQNVPQYESQAKEELIRKAYTEDKDRSETTTAIYHLIDLYEEETAPILAYVFMNHSYRPSTVKALEKLLEYHYPNLDQMMRERLIVDSSLTTDIAQSLLRYYPSVENYKCISDSLNKISNEVYRTFVSYSLKGFEPPLPDSNALNQNLLNNLIGLTDTAYNFNLIGDQSFYNEIRNLLQSADSKMLSGDSISSARDLKLFQDKVDSEYKDSLNITPSFVTMAGWKFLYYNAQYILNKLPEIPVETGFIIKLTNSTGSLLTTGSLQYYEGSWKDAVNNGDGTFKVITDRPAVSLRMTYEYGSQTVSNIPAQNNTYTFQTVNTQVQLQNSQGSLIDQGTVQYYAGAWREFGTTTNGIAAKELLPNTYSFRMTYAYGSNDKQQNIGANPTVVFQTVNAAVQLQNSQGTLIDEGTVQYYAGAWRTFGTTSNGVVNKELLPNNYSFRMTYEYISNDKQQNIGTNLTVVFPTTLTTIRVLNAQGQPVNNASVKYYAGAWRTIGNTVNGEVSKELLPANIPFRVNSGTVQQDKTQNTSNNPIVEFNLQ